jgi:hypothetical protein
LLAAGLLGAGLLGAGLLGAGLLGAGLLGAGLLGAGLLGAGLLGAGLLGAPPCPGSRARAPAAVMDIVTSIRITLQVRPSAKDLILTSLAEIEECGSHGQFAMELTVGS